MEDLDKLASPDRKPKWRLIERITQLSLENMPSEGTEPSEERSDDQYLSLTKDELIKKYERGILARCPRTGEAAKAAGVSDNTIRKWRERYGNTQQ